MDYSNDYQIMCAAKMIMLLTTRMTPLPVASAIFSKKRNKQSEVALKCKCYKASIPLTYL